MNCLYEHDYSGLIKKGNPTEDVLKQAFNKIYQEYLILDQSDKYNEVLDKTITVQSLNAQILFVDYALLHLAVSHNDDLVKKINDLGILCDLVGTESFKERERKLKLVSSRSKIWIMDKQIAEAELKKLQQQSAGKGTGREDFDDALDSLAQYRKVPSIRASEISVRQFCRGLSQMERAYQKLMGQTV